MDFPGSVGKDACNAGDPGLDSWVRKIPWRRKWLPNPVIPWTEEPGRLQSMGSHGVTRSQHNWANFTCTFKLMRQELACICGQSYLIVCDPMDYSPPDSCPWNFPGKNTGAGCHFILQRILQTQGYNSPVLRLLHWQADSLLLGHLGSRNY